MPQIHPNSRDDSDDRRIPDFASSVFLASTWPPGFQDVAKFFAYRIPIICISINADEPAIAYTSVWSVSRVVSMDDAKLSSPQSRTAVRRMRSDDEKSDPMFVNSVEKAFRVLNAFNIERPTLSLTQLAATTGLDVSATQRFAHTLVQLGYLRRNSRTKHYELTTLNLQVAYQFAQSNELIRHALPYIQHLSQSTEETTNLSVREGTEIVYIARFMSRHVLAPNVTAGRRLPIYCTAPGRAILSQLPPAKVRELLDNVPLRAYTPHTITRVSDILDKINAARLKGYSVCIEEMRLDDISVAAPVLGNDGQPVGAVNIAVSKARYTPELAELRFAPLVISAGRAISGGSGDPR
jgi:DNA-binding IclR family transcriptional regulator